MLNVNEEWTKRNLPAVDSLVSFSQANLFLSDASMASLELIQQRRLSSLSVKNGGAAGSKVAENNTRKNSKINLKSKVFENDQEALLFKTINLIRN